jgi:hypothetical protein
VVLSGSQYASLQCTALYYSGTLSAQSPFAVQYGTITAMFQSASSDIVVSNQIGVPFNISINGELPLLRLRRCRDWKRGSERGPCRETEDSPGLEMLMNVL